MSNKRFIYYDTETTGVRSDKDRVVELAAFDPERKRTFEKLINPGCPIPSEATAIHKITNEMVASAPSFKEIALEFMEFCEGEVILIAHNNDNFDLHFMRNEFQRCGMEMPSWKFLDTLKWARRYRPDLPRHTLQFLREIYNIPANNAHRALDDVVVLHQIFQFMVDDLSVNEIYDLMNNHSATQRSIQHMPFGKHQGQPLSKIPKTYIQWLSTNGVFEKSENQDLKAAFQKIGLLEEALAIS